MREIVNMLMRLSERNQPQDPIGWLMDLQATKWDSVNSSTGQIVGTSANGASVSIQIIPGFSALQFMQAVEVAIQARENGLSRISSSTVAYLQ